MSLCHQISPARQVCSSRHQSQQPLWPVAPSNRCRLLRHRWTLQVSCRTWQKPLEGAAGCWCPEKKLRIEVVVVIIVYLFVYYRGLGGNEAFSFLGVCVNLCVCANIYVCVCVGGGVCVCRCLCRGIVPLTVIDVFGLKYKASIVLYLIWCLSQWNQVHLSRRRLLRQW